MKVKIVNVTNIVDNNSNLFYDTDFYKDFIIKGKKWSGLTYWCDNLAIFRR